MWIASASSRWRWVSVIAAASRGAAAAVATSPPRRHVAPDEPAAPPSRDRPGDSAAAEQLPDLVHPDDEGRLHRPRRRPRPAEGGGAPAWRGGGEDPAHPRPYRPLRIGEDPRRRIGRADRGPARGRPILDRAAGG